MWLRNLLLLSLFTAAVVGQLPNLDGTNWDELMNGEKDSLVLFSHPGCTICHALEHILEVVSRSYADFPVNFYQARFTVESEILHSEHQIPMTTVEPYLRFYGAKVGTSRSESPSSYWKGEPVQAGSVRSFVRFINEKTGFQAEETTGPVAEYYPDNVGLLFRSVILEVVLLSSPHIKHFDTQYQAFDIVSKAYKNEKLVKVSYIDAFDAEHEIIRKNLNVESLPVVVFSIPVGLDSAGRQQHSNNKLAVGAYEDKQDILVKDLLVNINKMAGMFRTVDGGYAGIFPAHMTVSTDASLQGKIENVYRIISDSEATIEKLAEDPYSKDYRSAVLNLEAATYFMELLEEAKKNGLEQTKSERLKAFAAIEAILADTTTSLDDSDSAALKKYVLELFVEDHVQADGKEGL